MKKLDDKKKESDIRKLMETIDDLKRENEKLRNQSREKEMNP